MGLSSSYNGSRSKRRALNSEINVTPFVDVMLVLLIIFMVTSPMLLSSIEVDLPKTKTTPIAGSDVPIAITIDQSGTIYLQESPVAMKDLQEKLSALLKDKKDNKIFIRGDKKVDYGKIIDVFATLRASGLYNVSLVTELKNN